MRISFGAAVGALVGIGLASGAARAEDFTIGYSQFWGTNPFLVTMANGAKKAVDEWADKGVKVDMLAHQRRRHRQDQAGGRPRGSLRPGRPGPDPVPGRQHHRRRAGQEHLQQGEHPGRHHRHRPAVGQLGHVHHHRQLCRRPVGGRADGQDHCRRAPRSSPSTTRRATTTPRCGRRASRTRPRSSASACSPRSSSS